MRKISAVPLLTFVLLLAPILALAAGTDCPLFFLLLFTCYLLPPP